MEASRSRDQISHEDDDHDRSTDKPHERKKSSFDLQSKATFSHVTPDHLDQKSSFRVNDDAADHEVEQGDRGKEREEDETVHAVRDSEQNQQQQQQSATQSKGIIRLRRDVQSDRAEQTEGKEKRRKDPQEREQKEECMPHHLTQQKQQQEEGKDREGNKNKNKKEKQEDETMVQQVMKGRSSSISKGREEGENKLTQELNVRKENAVHHRSEPSTVNDSEKDSPALTLLVVHDHGGNSDDGDVKQVSRERDQVKTAVTAVSCDQRLHPFPPAASEGKSHLADSENDPSPPDVTHERRSSDHDKESDSLMQGEAAASDRQHSTHSLHEEEGRRRRGFTFTMIHHGPADHQRQGVNDDVFEAKVATVLMDHYEDDDDDDQSMNCSDHCDPIIHSNASDNQIHHHAFAGITLCSQSLSVNPEAGVIESFNCMTDHPHYHHHEVEANQGERLTNPVSRDESHTNNNSNPIRSNGSLDDPPEDRQESFIDTSATAKMTLPSSCSIIRLTGETSSASLSRTVVKAISGNSVTGSPNTISRMQNQVTPPATQLIEERRDNTVTTTAASDTTTMMPAGNKKKRIMKIIEALVDQEECKSGTSLLQVMKKKETSSPSSSSGHQVSRFSQGASKCESFKETVTTTTTASKTATTTVAVAGVTTIASASKSEVSRSDSSSSSESSTWTQSYESGSGEKRNILPYKGSEVEAVGVGGSQEEEAPLVSALTKRQQQSNQKQDPQSESTTWTKSSDDDQEIRQATNGAPRRMSRVLPNFSISSYYDSRSNSCNNSATAAAAATSKSLVTSDIISRDSVSDASESSSRLSTLASNSSSSSSSYPAAKHASSNNKTGDTITENNKKSSTLQPSQSFASGIKRVNTKSMSLTRSFAVPNIKFGSLKKDADVSILKEQEFQENRDKVDKMLRSKESSRRRHVSLLHINSLPGNLMSSSNHSSSGVSLSGSSHTPSPDFHAADSRTNDPEKMIKNQVNGLTISSGSNDAVNTSALSPVFSSPSSVSMHDDDDMDHQLDSDTFLSFDHFLPYDRKPAASVSSEEASSCSTPSPVNGNHRHKNQEAVAIPPPIRNVPIVVCKADPFASKAKGILSLVDIKVDVSEAVSRTIEGEDSTAGSQSRSPTTASSSFDQHPPDGRSSG